MSNVVTLKAPTKEPAKVWVCNKCDNTTFKLYGDGSVWCADCGVEHVECCWGKRMDHEVIP